MSNFFNAIGVADMEKVHSAVIGWIISDKCDAIGINRKSEILCGLFNVDPFVFDKINVKVEVYDIDILIITERNGIEECWVIENKIKSNQHGNQLDKYVRIIRGEEMTSGKKPKPITEKYKHIPYENQHYCFLTLIEESPIGTYQKLWINKQYCDLVDLLPSSSPVCSNEDGVIFKQYKSCITEMTNALKGFLNNPNHYPHVFTDGSKKKTEKEYLEIAKDSGKYALYIAENGLETIFQKCYLGMEWKKYAKTSYAFSKQEWEIKETKGTALLDIHLQDINDPITKEKYHAQIQFQDGSFKVQIHQIDNDWSSKNASGKQTAFLVLWNPIFDNVKNNGWKKNSPNYEGNRPYLSLSKKVTNWLADPDGLLKLWGDWFKECEFVLNKLVEKYYNWKKTIK